MSMRETSSRTKEWMKEHKEEVAKVQAKYVEYRAAPLDSLLELAFEVDADLSKVKEMLIAKIIATESTR